MAGYSESMPGIFAKVGRTTKSDQVSKEHLQKRREKVVPFELSQDVSAVEISQVVDMGKLKGFSFPRVPPGCELFLKPPMPWSTAPCQMDILKLKRGPLREPQAQNYSGCHPGATSFLASPGSPSLHLSLSTMPAKGGWAGASEAHE